MHPTHLLDADDLALLMVWQSWRPAGMGGVGHLPEQGGVLSQAACVMDAMMIMESAAAALKPAAE